MDLSVLHDDKEILSRIRDKLDVVDWIAVDEQQIGERALLHNPQLPRIGIARARQAKQLSVGGRRHRQYFCIRVPFGQMGQHRALPCRQFFGEKHIRAERRFDLIPFCQIVCVICSAKDLKLRDPARSRQLFGPGGVGTFSWPGAYGTWWQADPSENLILIYLIQNLPNFGADAAAAVAGNTSLLKLQSTQPKFVRRTYQALDI